jgi:Tellurite resistance protein TerB
MDLPDLNQDERTALVGLMKLIVMSDGEVSEDELEHVETLVAAFGDDGYQRTLDAFEARFQDEAGFKKFLQGIGRQDARDLIFGTVLEGAGEGALDHAETSLLDWLAQAWNVKIEIENDEEPGSI